MKKLFGKKIFDGPKPVPLIYDFVKIGTSSDDIILDFFSGSCTSAHSILLLNRDINRKCKFIMIQLPEPIDQEKNKEAYNFCIENEKATNISEIGKERIRKVINKIKQDSSAEEIAHQDLGFKVFKLQKSHFKEWKDYKGQDVQELMTLFSQQEDVLVDGWKKENLLVEVMLQEGFPLHSKVSKLEDVTKNEIMKVESDFCDHLIYVCLDEKIEQGSIDVLPLNAKDILVCLDSALTDEQKVILADKGVIKTI